MKSGARLHLIKLTRGECGPCVVCGRANVQQHLDTELRALDGRGLVCDGPDGCKMHVLLAEILLLAWLNTEEAR